MKVGVAARADIDVRLEPLAVAIRERTFDVRGDEFDKFMAGQRRFGGSVTLQRRGTLPGFGELSSERGEEGHVG